MNREYCFIQTYRQDNHVDGFGGVFTNDPQFTLVTFSC